ncbi:MAG: NTP transferase domain-containing protein [Deltaproteobacteria bacterium]|nr:NTP transferase domain-containing protein [Deltaproteobacteria bacterium]
MRITKAVIPAAGRGTRLAPLTTYLPKELLPVGPKPMIQYTVEMCMASGIGEFCFITSPAKSLLNDFLAGNWAPPRLPFKRPAQFYRDLSQCRTVVLTQPEPRGVAHAVLLARDFVGHDPFLCLMPDCLLFSAEPFAGQLMAGFAKYGKSIIGVLTIGADTAGCFGNVGVLETTPLDDRCFSITALSDKTDEPLRVKRGTAIYKGFGGGIYLPADYFDLMQSNASDAGGEVDDVPIHQRLAASGNLLGVLLDGDAFDAGHPLGYRAAVHFAGRLEASSAGQGDMGIS